MTGHRPPLFIDATQSAAICDALPLAITAGLVSDRSLITGRCCDAKRTASRTTSSILSPLSALITSDNRRSSGPAAGGRQDGRGFLSKRARFPRATPAAAVEDVDFVADAEPEHTNEMFGFVFG
jgi:hypothetical protein